MISVFLSCCCHYLIATYRNYSRIKVLSCKLEHLIYVEDDDDDEEEDDDDDAVEDEEDDEGFGRSRKGDVARAARLLGISLPQLGTKKTTYNTIKPIISTLCVYHKIIHQGISPLQLSPSLPQLGTKKHRFQSFLLFPLSILCNYYLHHYHS